MKAQKWQLLGSHQTANGIADIQSYVFLARGVTPARNNEQREEGVTDMKAFSLTEIMQMITNGEFIDGSGLSALMHLLAFAGANAELAFKRA